VNWYFANGHYYCELYGGAILAQRPKISLKNHGTSDPNASSLTFYQMVLWAIHVLVDLVSDAALETASNYF
jgi:hypothetical protein